MLRTTATVVVIVLLVGSLSGAAIGVDGERRPSMHDAAGGNGEDLEASSGQRLATVVAVTDVEVRSGLDESDFEERLREGSEVERAAAVVDRQTALLDRTDALVEERSRLARGYESDRLDVGAYAQGLVVLSARAMALERSLVRLESSASTVSAVELEAAGYDPSTTRAARSRLETVSGSGMSALLRLFTGEMGGSFDLRSEGGLSVEVENESGSSVREIERDVDRGTTLSIPAGDAVEAASAFLSEPAEGDWTLRRVAADNASGYYDVRFELRSADLEGEARARVDGETGAVFRFEEEVERRDDRDDDEGPDDDDDRHERIDIAIVNGSTQPGATITILATRNGEPVADARVEVEGDVVGRTDDDGRLTVDLPDDEDEVEIEIETESPSAEGDLELKFEDDEDEDRHSIERAIRENLLVRGSVENGSATLQVTYAGDPVENVRVYHDDRLLGSTDADGSLETSSIEIDDELELTLRKDRFETEVEFRFEGGELVRTEIESEFEDDGHEDRDDDRERDDDDDGEGDDDRDRDDDDREGDDDDGDEDDDREEGDDDDADERVDDDITVEVVSGAIEPGSSITILATMNGEPVADARVEVEGEVVGRTGDDGRLTVDLPDDEDDVEIEVESPDADGEVELDLEVGIAIAG